MRAGHPLVIGPLSESPLMCLDALVAESEASGLRLVRRLVEEWAGGINRFDRPGEALLGARAAAKVVGVCGLNADPYTDEPDVGRVRHLYVLQAYRRLGVGRRLVAEVMRAARGRFAVLRLRTDNPAAVQLYEELGFLRRTDVRDCTHVLELSGR